MLVIHEIGHASKQERVVHARVFMIDDDFDVSGLCWIEFRRLLRLYLSSELKISSKSFQT